MNNDKASYCGSKAFVFFWLMVCLFISCWILFVVWNSNVSKYIEINDFRAFKTYVYVTIGGFLGSVIYTLRGFYQSVVEQEDAKKMFSPKWIFWYMIRPFSGAVFGFVIYAFISSGFFAFGFSPSDSSRSNLMFFGLSFLTGFGFHNFAEFLNRKAESIFNPK